MSALRAYSWRDRLRWQGARAWAAVGSAELLALALLALWCGLQVQVLSPLGKWLATEQRQLAALQVQVAAARRAPAHEPGPGHATAEFLAFLPGLDRRDAQLQQLHALAQAQGLQLLGAHFALEPVSGLPATRQRLSLRLQGSYAAQRRFLHEALGRSPNLAVSRLALEEANGVMTAQVDGALLYRAEVGR